MTRGPGATSNIADDAAITLDERPDQQDAPLKSRLAKITPKVAKAGLEDRLPRADGFRAREKERVISSNRPERPPLRREPP